MRFPSLFTVQFLQTTHKNKTTFHALPLRVAARASSTVLGELRLGGAEGEDDHDVRGKDARELSEAAELSAGLPPYNPNPEE